MEAEITNNVSMFMNIRLAIFLLCISFGILLYITITRVYNINPFKELYKLISYTLGLLGKGVNRQEHRYYRDLEVGKIHNKLLKVRIYRFFNDLVVNLGYKRRGCTPYEFMWFTIVLAIVGSVLISQLVFQNKGLIVVLSPILYAGILGFFYTRGNITKDRRIDAIIESENVISNDITKGVVVGVRNSINLMPEIVREDFRKFLDNVENQNYHIRTGLMELNNNLGSTADDFIKQCIVFEMEEEHGIAGMFTDIVAVNNIKTELRTNAKRKFEETKTSILIGFGMVAMFLVGAIVIFPELTNFYLKHTIGQAILCLDLLVVVLAYVYIIKMGAKEVK